AQNKTYSQLRFPIVDKKGNLSCSITWSSDLLLIFPSGANQFKAFNFKKSFFERKDDYHKQQVLMYSIF
ncbi:MAG: hypothetical protein U9O87_01260, partial [Verrucomicrobiota bacterium]|nr:hypothetical protein [Verrucomicrobiota bacterium]